MVGLADCAKNFEDTYNRLTEYRLVTDGRTDRQTDILRHIVRAMHTRRAVKIIAYTALIKQSTK